ncbi:MAG: RNA polymerase sigma factor [Bacteroidales bacterium]
MTAIEFNHKVLSLKDKLQYFAYSLTSNQEDANDLIQDTLLKAISNKDKFDPATNMKAWVYTIMKNTFINKYRKDTKVNMVMDNTRDLYYLNTSSIAEEVVTPDSEYTHGELEKVVGELQDDHRIPFQMHFEGYKYKEIAESLNLSIGTVKSRIFFGRKKLMEQLKDFQN